MYFVQILLLNFLHYVLVIAGSNADQATIDSDVSNSMLSELQLDVSIVK